MNRLRSWRAVTPSSPASWEFVWRLDHQAVLAITGLQFHDLIGTYTQQDVALDKLFIDVAVYNERITGCAHHQSAFGQSRTAGR